MSTSGSSAVGLIAQMNIEMTHAPEINTAVPTSTSPTLNQGVPPYRLSGDE
jgi:hypothetical protein